MESKNYQSIPTATPVDDDDHYDDNNDDVLVVKGEPQPPAFRDPFFAVFFWIQVAVVVGLSVAYATGTIAVDLAGGRRLFLPAANDESVFFVAAVPCAIGGLCGAAVAPVLAVGACSVLAHHAIPLLRASVGLAVGINGLLAVLLLSVGALGAALLPGIAAVLAFCYAKAVWDRIPVAAAHLRTAVTAVRSQPGTTFVGVAAAPVGVLWWALWAYCFFCTLHTGFMESQVESTTIVHTSGPNDDDDFVNVLDERYSGTWWLVVFAMLVSGYWTGQVVGNTVRTTVAGAVGTFWFAPGEATGGGCCCCSPALSDSLFRSLTYSFGSICLGSLVVALVQALRHLADQAAERARRDEHGALLLCLLQCLLSTLESAAEYFNQWAFVYVGLYGYPYLEAGKNVLALFRQRGWSTIITDGLTARVLGMVALAVALLTGLVGGAVGALASLSSPAATTEEVAVVSLLVSLVVGVFVSNAVFGVVHGAADTVVVLFAEAPAEFVRNHPRLSAEMNRAWESAYPGVFRPVAPTIVV